MLQLRETTAPAPGLLARVAKTRIGPSGVFGETRTEPLPSVSHEAHRTSAVSWPEIASDLCLYTQPDPIGLEGGINLFAYAFDSPVANTDPDGTRTCVMFTRDKHAGMTFTTHMSMVVFGPCKGGGSCSRPSRFLYDPSGGYKPNRGSGRIFEDDDFSMRGYLDFHRKTGSKVELFCYDTSCCEEQTLFKTAGELGGGRSMDCAAHTSLCLSGLPRFGGFKPDGSPSACRTQLQNLRLQERR